MVKGEWSPQLRWGENQKYASWLATLLHTRITWKNYVQTWTRDRNATADEYHYISMNNRYFAIICIADYECHYMHGD